MLIPRRCRRRVRSRGARACDDPLAQGSVGERSFTSSAISQRRNICRWKPVRTRATITSRAGRDRRPQDAAKAFLSKRKPVLSKAIEMAGLRLRQICMWRRSLNRSSPISPSSWARRPCYRRRWHRPKYGLRTRCCRSITIFAGSGGAVQPGTASGRLSRDKNAAARYMAIVLLGLSDDREACQEMGVCASQRHRSRALSWRVQCTRVAARPIINHHPWQRDDLLASIRRPFGTGRIDPQTFRVFTASGRTQADRRGNSKPRRGRCGEPGRDHRIPLPKPGLRA